MKSFYQYIEEAYGQQSLSTEIFNLQGTDRIEYFPMPLGNANFKRVAPDPIRVRAFHVTGSQNIDRMIKGQNKKQGLSGFLSMKDSWLMKGVASGGGYVFELEADLLGSFERDIGSGVDKTGRRWILLADLLSAGTYALEGDAEDLILNDLGSLPKDIEKFVKKMISEYGIAPGIPRSKRPLKPLKAIKSGEDWKELPDIIQDDYGIGKEAGKVLSYIIKGYIDTCNKSYEKNANKIKAALTRNVERKFVEGRYSSYDEIIINKYKIKKMHVNHEYFPYMLFDSDAEKEKNVIWDKWEKILDVQWHDTSAHLTKYIKNNSGKIK
mgnify:CR=1 FL=1|tara:strand:+ start:188 stop:1159 length:972 start_codon:yes stop_codon:yes gene_type:complete